MTNGTPYLPYMAKIIARRKASNEGKITTHRWPIRNWKYLDEMCEYWDG
jgi:hypothetical protein